MTFDTFGTVIAWVALAGVAVWVGYTVVNFVRDRLWLRRVRERQHTITLSFDTSKFDAAFANLSNTAAATASSLTMAELQIAVDKMQRAMPRTTQLRVPHGGRSPVPLDEFWSPKPIQAFRTFPVTWTTFTYGEPPVPMLPDGYTGGVRMEAVCGRDRVDSDSMFGECDVVPGDNCPSPNGRGCGWYTFKEQADAFRHAAGRDRVVALVELSGRIIEHERGYRSQFMTIRALDQGADPRLRLSVAQLDWMLRKLGTNEPYPGGPPGPKLGEPGYGANGLWGP